MLGQRPHDTEVAERPCSASGEGNSDGPAGEQPAEAREIAGGILPQMEMGRCLARGNGFGRARRRGGTVAVQHHERALHTAGNPSIRQTRWLAGAGENKHEVRAAQTLFRPHLIRAVAGHDEKLGGRLEFVQPHGEARFPVAVGSVRRIPALRQDRPSAPGDFFLQSLGESERVATGGGAQNGNGKTHTIRTARMVGTLDAVELDARHVHDRLRTEPCELCESRAVQAGEDAITHGLDCCGALAAGEERHFPDGFSPGNLPHHHGAIVFLARGAQASAHHHIHRVGLVAFAEKRFAGGQLGPSNGGAQMGAGLFVESSEFFVQNLVEQSLAGLLQIQILVGCHDCAAN